MNPFCSVARAEAEAQRRYMAYKDALGAKPLTLAAVWEARRAWERARQRVRQVQNRLETWRRLRWERLFPALTPKEAGMRRLSWEALKRALGDVDVWAAGPGPWLLTTERLSLATRRAEDRWSFYVVAVICQALTCPDALQGELLWLPVEELIRLVRPLSSWGETLAQAEGALAYWAARLLAHPGRAAAAAQASRASSSREATPSVFLGQGVGRAGGGAPSSFHVLRDADPVSSTWHHQLPVRPLARPGGPQNDFFLV